MKHNSSFVESPNQKLELLDLLLAEEGISEADSAVITPRPNSAEHPLSFAQMRLWFLDRLEPGPHYNDQFNLCIRGSLDVAALRSSLEEIINRHEVLRGSFPHQMGEPMQLIAAPSNLDLPVADLSGMSESERLDEATRIAVEAYRKEFNLETGPLYRFTLIRLGSSDHLLLMTLHHIVIDGWSRSVFLKELIALYEAFRVGKQSPLSPLPIQYADFAAWQQEFIKSDTVRKQLDYWKSQLAGAPARLEWPTSFPRPAVQSFRGARKTFLIPKAIAEPLKALAQQEGCTLFMTLLAAFDVLASRYTGQEDIVIASPIANRTRKEIEGSIGYFLNTLVLRTDVTGNPTFRTVMSRVREVSLAAYASQDVPYEKLVEELRPTRDQSYNPIFQVMLVFQNAPPTALKTESLTFSPFDIDGGISKFDMLLNFEESAEGISGWIEYATDLFEKEAIDRLASHYQTLLASVAENPDSEISQLPILTELEMQQLREWNNTAMTYPKQLCVHQLFESRATESPNAVAVAFQERELIYSQLNARANQIAHRLRHLGIGPGKLAAICVERSAEMVAGLLGILKTGGAYVPLDPSLPKERLQFILQDADASVLIIQSDLLPYLKDFVTPSEMDPTIVCLDKNEDYSSFSQSNLEISADGTDPAYVIYTSGSTGRPKGVTITHAAVVNFLVSMAREPGFTSDDVLLAVTTLSFDIAGLELWLPISCGGKVVIAPREAILDGRQLARLITESGATVMQGTPTTWRMLLDSKWTGNQQLKILCGGEAWSPALASELHEKCASLWNMYGPTETTIWSAVSKVEPEQEIRIGRPIANTQFYVLDQYQQLLPSGVPGELWIGGDGLAQGYLKRPELTVEKFRTNPFTHEPGARIYRTGDLVRRRNDGTIEFLGRMDFQVKLRGFRIELGEIETVLDRHPQVDRCVVIAREDRPGEKRLVAYLAMRSEGETRPTSSDLREHLRSALPEYMVPTAFVMLDSLPLTPNGKVDRKALPAPDLEAAELSTHYLAPRGQTEEIIAKIWCKVLHRERVGVNDSFFDLGGHSLLMMQVRAQLCEALNINISIIKLFQYPTVSSLARQLSQTETESTALDSIQDRARLQREAFARQRQFRKK